jgi:polyphosphate kinase
VGNFLEHIRIFYFENDEAPEVYMASADWMPRNLDRRVEIMFPILDEGLREKAIHILEVQLADNMKAHILQPDGSYVKPDRRGKAHVCAQDTFCQEAVEAVKKQKASEEPENRRVFVPVEREE